MEKEILITFLVACYNSEAYLNVCLDSLLKCDNEKIEIILVDDGSKDKTYDVIMKYKNLYPNVIKVIKKENAGHGDAINDGVKNATGKFFKIVDSDDWVNEDALNKLLNAVEQVGDKVDLFVTNYVYYHGYDNPKRRITFHSTFKEHKICGWNEAKGMKINQNLTLHSCMFKLEKVKESGVVLPKKVSYEDNYFVYACLSKVRTFIYLNIDFYCYLIGRDGQSVNTINCIKRYKEHLLISKLINDYLDLMAIKKIDKPLYKILYHHLRLVMMIATIYARMNGSKEADKNFKDYKKDLKLSHKKLYDKMIYHSISGLLTVPGPFGRFFVRIIFRVANIVVPFTKKEETKINKTRFKKLSKKNN